MSEKTLRVRLSVVAGLLLAAMVGLGCRLAYLHLGPHEKTRADIHETRTFTRRLLAGRGRIYDRQGERNILAANLAVKDVCVDPSVIVRAGRESVVAQALSRHTGVPQARIAQCLDQHREQRGYPVRRFVREELAERIRQERLPGVFFQDEIIRHYPQGEFLCHVLGFVNHEGAGSAGIELWNDSSLRGRPGMLEGTMDARRREMPSKRGAFVAPVEGADVHLTLDQNVQYEAEQALDDIMDRSHARGAWAIVQLVRTGELLALASRPAYNPNDFAAAAENQFRNQAIGSVYEPGSTLKALAVAAALDQRTVRPTTVIDCENGLWWHCNRPLREHGGHGYGRLTVADGVKESSNILVAKVAVSLGKERYEQYLRAFGIGRRLGIDLPGEEIGLLRPSREWAPISVSRIAIGQGVGVTALQMLSAVSAIANDGFLMRPYVTSCILDKSGAIVKRTQPQVLARPISRETAATMRVLLRRVTEEGGTGTKARIEGWTVAGKTGTAQKPEAGGYSNTRHVASFVGFAPAENPEVAAIVVVDEPRGAEYYGGQVAAPAFARIVGQTLRYLDVPAQADQVALKTQRPRG